MCQKGKVLAILFSFQTNNIGLYNHPFTSPKNNIDFQFQIQLSNSKSKLTFTFKIGKKKLVSAICMYVKC